MVEKNNQLEEYKYPLIVIGGALLAAIILAIVVGRPLYNNMKKVNAELKEKKIVLAKLDEKLTNLRNLESKEEELKTKNDKVLAALPQDKDISRLFVQFEAVASQSGVSVDSVSEETSASSSAQGSTATANTSIVPIKYTVKAKATNYKALKRALSKFESALRILSISKIQVQKPTGSGLDLSFTITTFKRSN